SGHRCFPYTTLFRSERWLRACAGTQLARRRARELAFRTLFQAERGSDDLLTVWSGVRSDLAEEPEDSADDPYGDPLDRTALELRSEEHTSELQSREN